MSPAEQAGAPGPEGARWGYVTALLGVLAIAAVALVQPGLVRDAAGQRDKTDLFLLPPPDELRVMSLGYNSALCDILWGQMLVEYGRHWVEKRAFQSVDVQRFLDGLLALDPDFTLVYRYVDTLLVYRPPRGEEEDARAARRYLERGTREHPSDPEMWLRLGEFVAFLGIGWIPEGERDAWRRDGALAIARSIELGGKANKSLAAASLLSRAGERDAAIRSLERALVMADDEETRQGIRFQLDRLQTAAQAEERERRRLLLERLRVRSFPFLDRSTFLLVGPVRSPLRCVGGSSDKPDCEGRWEDALARP